MKSVISYEDFDKLELRAGRVVAAEAPEWSQKLLQFTVDFGLEIGQKTIFSGVKQWYEPELFVGQMYGFVINLAERKMGEGVSQGMMLMADAETQPILMPLSEEVVPGTVIR